MTIGQQIDTMLAIKAKINRKVYGKRPTCTITIDTFNNVTVRLHCLGYHGERRCAYKWKIKHAELEAYEKFDIAFEREMRECGAIIDEEGDAK